MLITGDFNVAHRPIGLKNDKANYNKTTGYTQVEIDGMDNFIDTSFVDIFRLIHPDLVAYTYWSYHFKARERNAGRRIDYFFGRRSLVKKITFTSILSNITGSDHCPSSWKSIYDENILRSISSFQRID